MKKETKCIIVNTACELLIGWGLGACLDRVIQPMDSKFDRFAVYAGGCLLGMPIGHQFSKSFYTLCDTTLGTNLVEEIGL